MRGQQAGRRERKPRLEKRREAYDTSCGKHPLDKTQQTRKERGRSVPGFSSALEIPDTEKK